MALAFSDTNPNEIYTGVLDINKKIIRTPLNPDLTYSNDPLRILRPIRFASQLGFKIEKNYLISIHKNNENKTIKTKERILTNVHKKLKLFGTLKICNDK